MVWGCILYDRPGRLHQVEGKMGAKQYCEILSESLLGSLADKERDPEMIIFQQDNDPKHTSRVAQAWFKEHNIYVLPWPPSFPDMNLIEHAWDVLDRQLRARPTLPSNLDELWEILQEEWQKLDMSLVRRLYHSMPHHTAVLWKANGSYTKY